MLPAGNGHQTAARPVSFTVTFVDDEELLVDADDWAVGASVIALKRGSLPVVLLTIDNVKSIKFNYEDPR